ncbi:MAG: transposase, partial [Kiritimatiellia bacterium]
APDTGPKQPVWRSALSAPALGAGAPVALAPPLGLHRQSELAMAERNEKAQRGYSRDSRPDCKQVCIGLVVTAEGLPVGYEVFAGNRTDVTTLEEMVTMMEDKYGKPNRIWVVDRGIVSEANLAFLRQRGAHYLMGTPKHELRHHEEKLLEKDDWEEVQDGLEVKLIDTPHGQERFVVCFLALALRRTLEQWMQAKGLGSCARQLLLELDKLKNDLDVLKKKADSVRAGARGIIFGRNIFMSKHPDRLIEARNDVINDGRSPEKAARRYRLS